MPAPLTVSNARAWRKKAERILSFLPFEESTLDQKERLRISEAYIRCSQCPTHGLAKQVMPSWEDTPCHRFINPE